jgi:hypothetical protein
MGRIVARQQMVQVNVTHEQVVETLTAPDDVLAGAMGELIAVQRYGTWELQVVYEEVDEDQAVVCTVMRTRV